MDAKRPPNQGSEKDLPEKNSTPPELDFLKEAATTAKIKPLGKKPLALHIFFMNQNSWHHKQFSFATTKPIRIGSYHHDNEIGLHDEDIEKTQAVIHKVNQDWYFMDSGKEDKICINGLPGKQLLIQNKSVNTIQIGNNFIILAYLDQINEAPHNILYEPNDNDCYFSFNNTEKFPIKFDKMALIGGNSLSSLYTAHTEFLTNVTVEEDKELFKKPFLGMIFKYSDVLFFQSFFKEIKTNNTTSLTPVPIQKIENIITFNKTEIKLNIPEFYLPKSSIPQIPQASNTVFDLIPLDKDDETLPEIQISSKMRAITIGRSSKESDVAIAHPTISRKHAQLIIYSKSIMLYDCASSNGTYINDEKVNKKTIKPGDRITFGEVEYFLCYASEEDS